MNYELVLKFPEGAEAKSPDALAAVLKCFVAGEALPPMASTNDQTADAPHGQTDEPTGETPPQKDSALAVAAPAGDAAMFSGAPVALGDEPCVSAVILTDGEGRARVEVSISFENKESLFREWVERTFALASHLGTEVVDPQLGGFVLAPEVERVCEKWGELRAYVLRTRGLDSLLEGNEPLMLPPPTFVERHWKMLLIALGILVAILCVHRSMQLLSAPPSSALPPVPARAPAAPSSTAP